MKLPIPLVKAWLELASTDDPKLPEARDRAINKILHHFGKNHQPEQIKNTDASRIKANNRPS
ncbi:hypothetical protein CMT41_18320 [Colwellia sp. MT41]|uniref:hypothetical protein n=1 Tax=Colwellia sp. MT41 TaxID=58049 RepID=UPI0007175F87|nr:hypothetical protein [Colwellia sp. MT41]ALO36479.1 hypothetical protein CMT41_18320 [Colwellia sp. MT41]